MYLGEESSTRLFSNTKSTMDDNTCLNEHNRKERKKEKQKQKHVGHLPTFLFSTFAMLFVSLGMLFIMKRLEDEQYIVIKAYNFTVFEIFEGFFVLSSNACPCTLPLHIESTDSMITA